MEILVISFLILVNGFFALSEIAIVSSKKARLEKLKHEGSIGAKIALDLLHGSENFLSAIQVGITFIGIVTGMYGGINIAGNVSPFFESLGMEPVVAHKIALTVTVLVITYVSIVIGELVPKTVALSNPERIAVRVSPFIRFFSRVFYPFVKLLSLSTSFVNKILGIKKHTEQMTEAELRYMIKTASNEGVIEKEQNIIHEKVFYFSDKKAKHIMTHRTDLEWIDIDKGEEEILAALNNVQHSKIVVSKGILDDFLGILNLKDVYKTITAKVPLNISTLLIEPLIVPESADAQKVLTLMRQNKNHICCVVNEYGGLEGIITLHDIIENIVGEIPEEGENTEPDVFVREDKSVLVSADAPIETLTEVINGFVIDFDEIDYSTVGGFVLNQLNSLPRIGDKFEHLGYIIEIVDIDINRVDKILITKKS